MRTLLHVSDLHFGRVNNSLLEPLRRTARNIAADLTVISGDLTQRARAEQFKAARAFLDDLPSPRLVVPGNHDIPLHNPVARFLWPLNAYRTYISTDLSPVFEDGELAVLGINTARSFTRDKGSIDSHQIRSACEYLRRVDGAKTKIIVTHHPFDVPVDLSNKYVVRKAAEAMSEFSAFRADLFLAGHAHVSHAESSVRRYRTAAHASLIVQAGTGTSTRTRNVPNSFNVLRIDRPTICIEHWMWDPAENAFVAGLVREFRHSESGWQAV